jgi:hypothetical protein
MAHIHQSSPRTEATHMLIGYNNDVQYRGKVFHIQTEDRGVVDQRIETQIFFSGAILDTRIVPYGALADEADTETRNRKLKVLMQTTHRELYKKLLSGEYDAFAGLEPQEKVAEALPVEVIEEFQPGHERVPDVAREIEAGGSFEIKEAGDHVDLRSLKAKLARVEAASGAATEEDDDVDIPTQITSLDGISLGGSSLPDKPASTPRKPSPLPSLSSLAAPPRPRPLDPLQATTSWKATGVSASRGCPIPQEDLSITALVEALLK